jgi:hypothetical protein
MSNPVHIWYIIISTIIIAAFLLLFRLAPFFQKDRTKNLTLFLIALTAFLMYRSELWLAAPLGVLEFRDVSITTIGVSSPCAASMLGLLIVGIMAVHGRGGIIGKWLAVGVAYIGFIGAFATIYLSPRYAAIDFFTDWYMATNLFAHSILLLGCIYLITGGFIEIKVCNILPVLALGLLYILIGGIGILLCLMFRLDLHSANPMYFFEPFGGIYPLYGMLLYAIAAAFTVAVSGFYEFVFLKPSRRFYKNWTKDYWLKQ